MLPMFPQFKNLELSDKGDVERITLAFPPYSDFNFVSMWSWDISGEMRLSQLNDNLVVRFTDYLTSDPFYTFLGNNKVNETAEGLMELASKEGLDTRLKLVPEISVGELDAQNLCIEEDRNHFDYILCLNKLADFKGQLRGHSGFARRFIEQYSERISTKILELDMPEDKAEIASLTTIWMGNKFNQNKTFLDHLEDAIKRFLLIQDQSEKNLVSIGVFFDEKLVAFTINELVDQDYCVCHFMKADNSFKGIYSYLVRETSRILLTTGRKYINFEQDLGLPNLRQSKKTFKPITFLKKFTVNYTVSQESQLEDHERFYNERSGL